LIQRLLINIIIVIDCLVSPGVSMMKVVIQNISKESISVRGGLTIEQTGNSRIVKAQFRFQVMLIVRIVIKVMIMQVKTI